MSFLTSIAKAMAEREVDAICAKITAISEMIDSGQADKAAAELRELEKRIQEVKKKLLT